tara:strand:- start:168 stop:464 length:297 start_codon:yes stop_codon:yes gene_type:complete
MISSVKELETLINKKMKENENQLKETQRILKRLYQNGDMTPESFTILNDRNKQAINYTRCCKSDSEQLHTEVFNLANKLAINGYGNEAVKMHRICNGM